ncbi:MAG: 5'/3'-nucleotidase SurE [Alistipes sp.]|jgi:5'-nucleotidase|nr:5'/3'-nucleotidase SurE [Alistipes sp.]MBR0339473.1 5'/3'-nucleotidase SurE [Alistipes sp.]
MERVIFLTNDDSYRSKGFDAAIEIARQFGRVIAIAPDTPQSGMSQAITIYNPLRLRKVREEEGVLVYSLNGTPVDCVKMAFDHFFKDEKIDLVISGINHGSNAAVNVLYSGTMGAAIEGAFYNIPSIGLSLTDHDPDADFEGAIKFGTQIVESVLNGDCPQPLCLNVNVPNIPCAELKGIRLSRQTRGYWREEFFERTDPHGRNYYWLTGAFSNAEPQSEDTDEWALANGYVAVVPVQVDLTAYNQMEQLKKIL